MAGLKDILARVEAVVGTVVPDTDPAVRFVVGGDDLSLEEEPATAQRRFEVRPAVEGLPGLTRVLMGADSAQYEAGFELAVRYDLLADRDDLRGLMLEDAERLLWSVEMDTGWPAGTREVRHDSTRIEGEGHHWKMTLNFRAIYERTF